MRIAICFVVASTLLLCGCDGQSPPVQTITSIGEAVQSPQAQALGDSVTHALTSVGTATTAAVDPVKDSLTSLGESVQAGTDTVSDTLTSVGQTVIDATNSRAPSSEQHQ